MMVDKRLLRETRAVRLYWALTVGLNLGGSLLVVLQASYLARVVNRAFIQRQGLTSLWPLLWLLLVVIVFRALLIFSGEVTAHQVAARVKYGLRQRLTAHILALGPLYTKGERTGELVNVLVEGVEALDSYFSRYLPQLSLAALAPLLILGFVFPLDVRTGLILLLTAPLIPVFMWLIGSWAETLTRRQWGNLSRMSAHFLDVLQGITTIKLFNRSKFQIEVIARVSDNFRRTTLGVLRVAFLSALVLEFIATISTAIVAVTLGLRLVYARVAFEQAFFLLLLAPEFYLPLRLLGSQFHAGQSGVAAADRIFEVLDTPLPANQGERSELLPAGPSLHISFRDVYYAYEQGARPALNGLSFDLHPGEQVALVGPSGAGKSTVANLLLKFIGPDRGEIMINGLPLSLISPDQWYRYVAVVPQHPHLFYGTVRDNISLGQPEADLAQVVAAAQMAGADEFINRLPRGYETPIGENGIRLSGGQIRRLAIARAWLQDAPLLILDEATAGLDPASEQVVQQSLERLMQGRTVLVIAHRLSTVYRARRILVMAGGRLVESGGHQALMDRQGLYYRLVSAFGGTL